LGLAAQRDEWHGRTLVLDGLAPAASSVPSPSRTTWGRCRAVKSHPETGTGTIGPQPSNVSFLADDHASSRIPSMHQRVTHNGRRDCIHDHNTSVPSSDALDRVVVKQLASGSQASPAWLVCCRLQCDARPCVVSSHTHTQCTAPDVLWPGLPSNDLCPPARERERERERLVVQRSTNRTLSVAPPPQSKRLCSHTETLSWRN